MRQDISEYKIILVDEQDYDGSYSYKLSDNEKPKGWISINRHDMRLCEAAQQVYELIHKTIDDREEFYKHKSIHISPSMILGILDLIRRYIQKTDISQLLLSELCWYRSRLESLYQSWISTERKGHFYYVEQTAA